MVNASAVLSQSSLFTQAWANVYNLISSNITNPIPEVNKFIYKREPDVKAMDFGGYPLIIIFPVSIDIGDRSVSYTSGYTKLECNIELRSSDRLNGKHNGRGAEYLDLLSDSLIDLFNDVSNQNQLRQYLMARPKIEVIDTSIIDAYSERIFVRRFRVTFDTRIVISS